jgi:hypothetical protein
MEPSPEPTALDRIALTIPSDDGYRNVATLVLGGIGTRFRLPYERVDDLQPAVLSALDARTEGEAELEFEIDEEQVRVTVGPLAPGSAGDEALARVLSRLADGVEAVSRDGGDWITLRLARATTSA